MTNRPIGISAIMTVHNGEPHLSAALHSWARQTEMPAEFIVYNDASTDATAQILADSALPLRVINGMHRVGTARGRTAAVEAARQSWLMFLDADDLWHPDAVRAMRMTAGTGGSPEAHAFFGKMRTFIDPSVTPVENNRLVMRSAWQPAHIPGTLLIRKTLWSAVNTGTQGVALPDFQAWYAEAVRRGVSFSDCDVHLLERRIWRQNQSRTADARLGMLKNLRAHLAAKRALDP